VAFLRRRPRSVPSLPPPRFALGLAFVKSGSPRLYAPPSRSRIGAERQASPTPIPARESILVLAGRAERLTPDDYKAVTPIFIFEKCPSLVRASHAHLSPSMQLANLWRGVECRCVVTEVAVGRLHIRFETPLS